MSGMRRLGGWGDQPLWPLASIVQRVSTLVAPAGRRHAIPMIAIGLGGFPRSTGRDGLPKSPILSFSIVMDVALDADR